MMSLRPMSPEKLADLLLRESVADAMELDDCVDNRLKQFYRPLMTIGFDTNWR